MSNQKKILQKMRTAKVFDVVNIEDDFIARKIPGGWIYTEMILGSGTMDICGISSVFVPDGFLDKEI